jgi:hypothetical protein
LNDREGGRDSRGESFAESLDAVSLNCGWNRVTVTLGIFVIASSEQRRKQEKWKILTWIACLADFSSAPVKIATFFANPVTRLVFNRTFVACIEDRRVLRIPRVQTKLTTSETSRTCSPKISF